jgi:hypothetical protein
VQRDGYLVAGRRFVFDDWKVEVGAALDVHDKPIHAILSHLQHRKMHRRTYCRLYSESVQHEGVFMRGVMSFLNLSQIFQRGNG